MSGLVRSSEVIVVTNQASKSKPKSFLGPIVLNCVLTFQKCCLKNYQHAQSKHYEIQRKGFYK